MFGPTSSQTQFVRFNICLSHPAARTRHSPVNALYVLESPPSAVQTSIRFPLQNSTNHVLIVHEVRPQILPWPSNRLTIIALQWTNGGGTRCVRAYLVTSKTLIVNGRSANDASWRKPLCGHVLQVIHQATIWTFLGVISSEWCRSPDLMAARSL